MLIERLDQMHAENQHKEIYEELRKAERSSDPEVLWRFARACYFLAYPLQMKEPRKKQLLDEAYVYASEAYKMDPENFEVVKCFAAITGARTDFLGTKEKIEQGNLFKDLLDKALSMNTEDGELLHMRGRFAFSVASLSWFERKAATALYSKPPDATYEEAIRDFLAVLDIQPEWLDNLFYLGKAHMASGDRENALKFLRRAVESYQQDENEPEPDMLKEAKATLKKFGGGK